MKQTVQIRIDPDIMDDVQLVAGELAKRDIIMKETRIVNLALKRGMPLVKEQFSIPTSPTKTNNKKGTK